MYQYEWPKVDVTASVIAYHSTNNALFVVAVVRGKEPYNGMVALPGGFIEPGKENLQECAARELKEETNIVVPSNEMRLLMVNSNIGRDPRGHVIDNVFTCSIDAEHLLSAKADDDAADLKLVKVARAWCGKVDRVALPEFAFDHGDSVWDFIGRVRYDVGSSRFILPK